MSKRKLRLVLNLTGRLDQEGLTALRERLGLRRAGRLTDLEDEQFGSRDYPDNGSPAANIDSTSLTLWRDSVDHWHFSVDAPEDADVPDEEIARLADEAAAAAGSVGFYVAGRRTFPVEKRPSYETEWRNENWLRTTGWDLPARTLRDLWPVLGLSASDPDEDKRAALGRFTASPTWEAAPPGLRREAEEFLR
ncbi:hypothetical protein [Actinocrispum sp. NPDC049592]|uniref:hypothetical protein n=1 Tax=Actinocrispum sp. NPDC049592 TaxID=3154835 RepID=UPI0034187567